MHARRLLPLALLLAGCDGDVVPAPTAGLPVQVEVAAPDRPVRALQTVEDWSEQVANDLLQLADKVRRRDWGAARAGLTGNFAGHGWGGLRVAAARPLPLAALREELDVSSPAVVGPDDFLAQLAEHIGPWQHVEHVLWKVKGAEFQRGRDPWGRVRLKISLIGSGADGGPRSLVAWAHARVERAGDRWRVARLHLDSLTRLARDRRLFSDVSPSAGVAHTGARFGSPPNDSFAFNGAAAGDVDGDGLFDLFVPSRPRSFLYLARPQGGFDEGSAEWGLSEHEGGTGAVFFDADNDGDQDLAIADVGWNEPDGSVGGSRLALYENDGEGGFREVGAERGFDAICAAFSLTVLDFDGDGWLDVFVCNYGREEVEPNDSWVDATNGKPNLLLRNVGGKRFEDATARAGLADTRWTYAAAAADFDADGDQDLYVTNDYGPNTLWRNRGDGTFEDATDSLGLADPGNGMACAWGDLDNDGRLDLYVSNMSSTAGKRILERLAPDDETVSVLQKLAAGNSIFLQRAGGFERLPASAGGVDASWAWGVVLVDLDLDGRLDVYCVNGFITGDTPADT